MVDVVRYAEPVTAKGFVVMDTPGLRPGEHDRHRRRRGERAGVHDRPRQRVRLQAGPVDQGGDEHAAVRPHDRRHGHQRRRDPGRGAGGGGRPARSSRRSWRWRAARRPRARSTASARRSSPRGRSGRRCNVSGHIAGIALPFPAPLADNRTHLLRGGDSMRRLAWAFVLPLLGAIPAVGFEKPLAPQREVIMQPVHPTDPAPATPTTSRPNSRTASWNCSTRALSRSFRC